MGTESGVSNETRKREEAGAGRAACQGLLESTLFKRETEHLCLRQPIHGIGRDPFCRNETVTQRECTEREREIDLFKRETEHLCLRQPIHGIGRDPFSQQMRLQHP